MGGIFADSQPDQTNANFAGSIIDSNPVGLLRNVGNQFLAAYAEPFQGLHDLFNTIDDKPSSSPWEQVAALGNIPHVNNIATDVTGDAAALAGFLLNPVNAAAGKIGASIGGIFADRVISAGLSRVGIAGAATDKIGSIVGGFEGATKPSELASNYNENTNSFSNKGLWIQSGVDAANALGTVMFLPAVGFAYGKLMAKTEGLPDEGVQGIPSTEQKGGDKMSPTVGTQNASSSIPSINTLRAGIPLSESEEKFYQTMSVKTSPEEAAKHLPSILPSSSQRISQLYARGQISQNEYDFFNAYQKGDMETADKLATPLLNQYGDSRDAVTGHVPLPLLSKQDIDNIQTLSGHELGSDIHPDVKTAMSDYIMHNNIDHITANTSLIDGIKGVIDHSTRMLVSKQAEIEESLNIKPSFYWGLNDSAKLSQTNLYRMAQKGEAAGYIIPKEVSNRLKFDKKLAKLKSSLSKLKESTSANSEENRDKEIKNLNKKYEAYLKNNENQDKISKKREELFKKQKEVKDRYFLNKKNLEKQIVDKENEIKEHELTKQNFLSPKEELSRLKEAMTRSNLTAEVRYTKNYLRLRDVVPHWKNAIQVLRMVNDSLLANQQESLQNLLKVFQALSERTITKLADDNKVWNYIKQNIESRTYRETSADEEIREEGRQNNLESIKQRIESGIANNSLRAKQFINDMKNDALSRLGAEEESPKNETKSTSSSKNEANVKDLNSNENEEQDPAHLLESMRDNMDKEISLKDADMAVNKYNAYKTGKSALANFIKCCMENL